MKHRLLYFLIGISFALNLQAQSYQQLWNQVEKMEKQDLPKSAITEAQRIYDKAKAERNVPQMMKAYLTIMTHRGNISPDSIPVDVKGLEEWAKDADTQVQDRAVLYSILGGICIRDTYEKGDVFLRLSLKDSLQLVDYPAGKMVPMVESGKTSQRYMNDNLLDLLARRAIGCWEECRWGEHRESVEQIVRQTYATLLGIYQRKGMRSAWILTALNAYPFDVAKGKEWIKEYGDLDVCAEVYYKMASVHNQDMKSQERLELLREGIRRYPHYARIAVLKNAEADLIHPALSMKPTDAFSDAPIKLTVNHRNIQGVTFQIYRLNLSADSKHLREVNTNNVTQYGKLVRQQHLKFSNVSECQLVKEEMTLDNPGPGIYYIVAVPDGHKNTKVGGLTHITRLQVFIQRLSDGQLEIVVLDGQKGHPVPGAQFILYEEQGGGYVSKEKWIADAQGVVLLPEWKSVNMCFQAQIEGDTSMVISRNYISPIPEKVGEIERILFYTERGIYRPGQQVHYSGIVYRQLQDSARAKEGSRYVIDLKDPDNQKVASQEVVTDAFGSFQGTFELPSNRKMGAYRISTLHYGTSFQVEEYKRPTFEVVFDTVRTAYRAGDSIRLTGVARSFTGVPVQQAKVKYRIEKRGNRFWVSGLTRYGHTEGEAVTDEQGRFEVPVYLEEEKEPEGTNVWTQWFYDYAVIADVTGVAGETQQGSTVLPLGSSSLIVRIFGGMSYKNVPKEKPQPLTLAVANLKNVPVSVEVTYQVFREEKNALGNMTPGECVLQGTHLSNEEWIPEDIYALPSGDYCIKAVVKDEHGKECEAVASFWLFSFNDKRVITQRDSKFVGYVSGYQFDEEEDVIACFGTQEKDVYLFYDVYTVDKRIESKRLRLSDSLLVFRYPYREEYGDGILVNFTYVKEGSMVHKGFYIQKPLLEKKTLQLKWKTFRDKLQPGEKEKWTLSVLHPSGKPANARMLATLYDASLDRLKPFDWDLWIYLHRQAPFVFQTISQEWLAFWYFNFPRNRITSPQWHYSRLFEPFKAPLVLTGSAQSLKRASSNNALFTMDSSSVLEESRVESAMDVVNAFGRGTSDYTEAELEKILKGTEQMPLRSNFAETAFFYPQLHTDANGDVNIEFTLPESLTEWKFMGVAYTQDIDYGLITDKTVARKEFMIQPNLPRFLRMGDEVEVAASLSNLTEQTIQGTVWMELFVPETEKVVWKQKRPFEVKANETGKVSFGFKVSDKYEGLGVRMIADGGSFSDGEQRYLPVLSNKQKLTESVLLSVNGAGKYTFSLESLFNGHSKTVTRPKMTVEFTGNPLWYAVQALKVLENPDNDNVISWTTAYYANSMMDYWARTEPRIADSLNVEGIGPKISEAMMKLKGLQNGSGAWSWYPGMPGSRFMTTYVVELMTRLQQMTDKALDGEMKQMYQQAMEFLRREVEDEVRYLREAEKAGTKDLLPSEQALQYLYICALNQTLNPASDVEKFLLRKLAENNAKYTIYGKAIGAIVLHHAGKTEQAQTLMQSLMEYSVQTEEMGRYFDTSKAQYSWYSYKIPTEVAAIEAAQLVLKDEEAVEQMKRWLLKQKQAQVWDTPVETADAVYALLKTGKDWLEHTGAVCIQLGGNVIRTSEKDPLAYVKEAVSGKVMNIKKVTVEKETAGIGWGAVYAEFEENLEQVQAHGNALNVERVVMRDGVALSEGTLLQVGDKLTVRIVVKADRDMDFVQLKDERAACLEPVDALSGYRWGQRLGYYLETKDTSTSFYLDRLRKGTHVLEYDVYVTSSGRYVQGVVTAQSVYAPEFRAHGVSGSLSVK